MSLVALKRRAEEKYFNKISQGGFSLNGNNNRHHYQGNVNLIESKEKLCVKNYDRSIKTSTLTTAGYHSKIFKCHPCPNGNQQKSQFLCGTTNAYETITSSERTKKLKDNCDDKCNPIYSNEEKCIIDARKCKK